MNYIKLSEVINEVKVFYNSYFESGLDLDESIILPSVRLLLARCSQVIHPIDSTTIEIKDYKGCLPKNFFKLKKVMGSKYKEYFIPPSEVDPIIVTEFHTDYKINCCDMNACQTETGEYINIIQKMHDGTLVKYPHVFPIAVSERTEAIPSCKTKDQEEQIDIHNNEITTSFPEGKVFIEYYTVLKEDGEIIIPDNEFIINACREKIKEVILEFLLANSTAPVSNIYQLQALKSREATAKMITVIKTTEFGDMGKIQVHNKKKFNSIRDRYN